jgi:phage anti-repressor protein
MTQTQELIPIGTDSINGQQVQTVDARKLHGFLEVGTEFKDWIVRRIEDYGFESEKDFCSFLSESTGGRPSKEYHLTLDMAKEIAMVERSEKGREVRRYFIECEKRLKTQAAHALSFDEKAIRREVVNAVISLQEWLKRTDKSYDWLRRLVRYRKVNGLHQWEAGKLLGCSKDTVRRNEKLLKESGLWEVL